MLLTSEQVNYIRQRAQDDHTLQILLDAVAQIPAETGILSQFFQFSPVYVFIKDHHFRYIRLSHNFGTLLDVDLNDLMGQTDAALWPPDQAQIIHDEDVQAIQMHPGQHIISEVVLASHGENHTFSAYKFPLDFQGQRYIGGIAFDITGFKREQDALERHDHMLRAISNAATRFLTTHTWNGDLIQTLADLGEAARISRVYIFENVTLPDGDITMYQRYEWCAPGITPQSDNPELQALPYSIPAFKTWREVLSAGAVITRVVRLMPDDMRSLFEAQDIQSFLIAPIHVSGAWWGFIGFDDCETEHLWASTEIGGLRTAANIIGAAMQKRQQDATVQSALEHERELGVMKSRFLSMVSHEFRNPLAMIQAAADMLGRYRDRLDTDQYNQRIGTIHAQVTRMAAMVDDVIALGRSESRDGLRLEAVDLVAYCQERADEIAALYPAGPHIQITARGPCADLHADEGLLHPIINNLLSNAVKYSPGTPLVKLDLDCTDDALVITVTDQGIGIPAADQAALFESFRRGSNVNGIPGSGLGLAIVRQAVDTYGGSIEFESQAGIGTRFTVWLPLTI